MTIPSTLGCGAGPQMPLIGPRDLAVKVRTSQMPLYSLYAKYASRRDESHHLELQSSSHHCDNQRSCSREVVILSLLNTQHHQQGAMPHSTTPEAMSSPAPVKDEPMEEAGIEAPLAPADAPAADVDMDESKDTKKDIKKLEDLFDDVDSDDEFPSSAPVQPSSQVAPASPTLVPCFSCAFVY